MKTKTLTLEGGLVTEPGVEARRVVSCRRPSTSPLSAWVHPETKRLQQQHSQLLLRLHLGCLLVDDALERNVGAGALLLGTGTASTGLTSLRVGLRGSTFSTISGVSWGAGIVNGGPRPACLGDRRERRAGHLRRRSESGPAVLDYLTFTARRLGVPWGWGSIDRTPLSGATASSGSSACYAVVFVFWDLTTTAHSSACLG